MRGVPAEGVAKPLKTGRSSSTITSTDHRSVRPHDPKVFANAHYWVAIINDQDQGHAAAKAISRTLQGATIFTTEEALADMLAFFSERGRHLRQLTAATVRSIAAVP